MLVAIKENTDLNVLNVACVAGSFHMTLDMFISTLNSMKNFTNKKTFI